jgi:hypothetical protein
MDRRSVLKVAGAVTAAATALVALPRVAFAAYSDNAFQAKGWSRCFTKCVWRQAPQRRVIR